MSTLDTSVNKGAADAEQDALCAYCVKPTPASDFTLEHAIPQFLGGAQAPDEFRLYNICKRCNNTLGTFVDGAYAKSWLVTNGLTNTAIRAYDGKGRAIPLTCIGEVELEGVTVPDDCPKDVEYIQELWTGPSGEPLVWIRRKDDELFGYTGGSPMHRGAPGVAYWFPTTDDPTRLQMGFASAEATFKKRRKTRLVLACEVDDTELLGQTPFVEAGTADRQNIDAIRRVMHAGMIRARISMDTRFDQRFACKLALGVGYGMFGEAFGSTDEASELRRGLWPRDQKSIQVRGVSTFGQGKHDASLMLSYPGAVVITVLQVDGLNMLTLTIDGNVALTVGLGAASLPARKPIDDGYVLLLFPHIDRCIETDVAGLLGHAQGVVPLLLLSEIDRLFEGAAAYRAHMAPMPAMLEPSSGSGLALMHRRIRRDSVRR